RRYSSAYSRRASGPALALRFWSKRELTAPNSDITGRELLSQARFWARDYGNGSWSRNARNVRKARRDDSTGDSQPVEWKRVYCIAIGCACLVNAAGGMCSASSLRFAIL